MDFPKLFKALGIERYRLVGDKNYMFPCVYPDHKELKPSFSMMAKPPYYFQCFGCGQKGTVVKLAMQVKKLNPLEAIKYLEKFGYVDEEPSFDDEEEEPREDPELVIPPGALVPFREWRGLTEETVKEWELAFDPVLKRVVFPIRDISGRLVGAVGRTTIKSSIKYFFYGDFKKGRHVYGLHRCTGDEPLVIVEGNYDAVKLWHLGVKNVCALMGALSTDTQVQLIKQKAKKVWVALDNDFAGQSGTRKLVRELRGVVDVSLLTYPEGKKDAGDLKTAEDVAAFLSSRVCSL